MTNEPVPEGTLCVEYFKKNYMLVQKTYSSLPNVDDLNENFEILDWIQREKVSSPNQIRLAIGASLRWVNGWTGILHDLVLPNQQNAISLQESGALTEEERETVNQVLNWIMYRNRTWTLLLIERQDAREVNFLIEFHQEWKIQKTKMTSIMEKTRTIWENKMNGNNPKEKAPNYTG